MATKSGVAACRSVVSNDEALTRVQTRRPDVIVIDFLRQEQAGLALCRQLKQDLLTATIPLVIVTSRNEEADIITGLALGVEVYLTRPFSPRLLLAHIQAALRRGRAGTWEAPGVIVYGSLAVHPERHEMRVADQPVLLRPLEFRILLLLVQHPGQVLSRRRLFVRSMVPVRMSQRAPSMCILLPYAASSAASGRPLRPSGALATVYSANPLSLAQEVSHLEIKRIGREHLFGPDRCGDDLLAVCVLDERLNGWAIRCEATGQGIATADQFLVLQHETVSGCGRSGCGEALQVELLRRLEGAQQLRRDPGMLGEHGVLDHDEAVHWKNPRPLVPFHL